MKKKKYLNFSFFYRSIFVGQGIDYIYRQVNTWERSEVTSVGICKMFPGPLCRSLPPGILSFKIYLKIFNLKHDANIFVPQGMITHLMKFIE
jgi:hypothetical protein